jgi:uncharacterized protein YndB with AHSA1/START domain
MKAPTTEIFAAWTDPTSMQHWLAQTAEADARIGGQYRLEAHADPRGQRHAADEVFAVIERRHARARPAPNGRRMTET